MKTFSAVIGVVALAAAGAANAAGFWVDDIGRSLQMMGQPSTTPLEQNGHSLHDAVSAFKQLCTDQGVGKASSGKLAEATSWGFVYQQEMVPFKEPVDIGGWRAKDAILNVSDGIFFNKYPQCNLQVKTTDSFDGAAIRAAVTAAFGEPSNIAKANKKDGSPNRGYQPEWAVSLNDGSSAKLFARPSVDDPTIVHLAVLKKAEKK